MRDPVTIGLCDSNELVCIITVERNDVDRAFQAIHEGWDMWYSATSDEEREYPEDWDKEDWTGYTEDGEEVDCLYDAGYNEPVYYLLDKRNIEYVEENEKMEEFEASDVLNEGVLWGVRFL